MLPPLKNTKLAVNALSKSLKISEKEARQYLAQALEHETWDAYVKKANSQQHEQLDRLLSPDIANNRKGNFAENLMHIFDLHSTTANQLAIAINPFADTKPKPYRIDMQGDGSEHGVNMQDMFDMAGGKDGMLECIHRMADSNPELAMLKDFDDFDDLQEKMRISWPLCPGSYYDAIDNITSWELDDTNYQEEYEYLEASFHLVSSYDEVSYPVYLVGLTASPGDSNDEVFNNIKRTISGYRGRALILFRHPCHKVLNDCIFAVIGCFFNGKDWSWTLLTDKDPETQSKIILPNNFDLESPKPAKSLALIEYGEVRADIVYQSVVSGKVNSETGQLEVPKSSHSMAGVAGWITYIM